MCLFQVVDSDCERATGQEKEKCRKSNKNTPRIKTKLGHRDETKVGVEAGRGELKATVGYEENHRKKTILKKLSNVEMDEKREGKGSDGIQSDVKTSRTQITTTETAPITPRKSIFFKTYNVLHFYVILTMFWFLIAPKVYKNVSRVII